MRPPQGVMDVKRWHDQLTPAQRAAYQRGLDSIDVRGNNSDAGKIDQSANVCNGFESA